MIGVVFSSYERLARSGDLVFLIICMWIVWCYVLLPCWWRSPTRVGWRRRWLCPITVAASIDKSQECDFMRRRANHSYPRAMRRWHNPPVVVEPIEWISLEDAPRQLNKSKIGIGFLVGAGILVPTESSKGEKGITRSSLSDEVAWRSSASLGAWLKRLLRYIFYSLS